jgi:hypothetical protein
MESKMSTEASTRTHKVEQGETLSSLALKHYGDASKWRVLQRANKLESEDIFVGEELIIPEIAVAPSPVEPVIDPASIPMSMRERGAMKRGEWKPYVPAGSQQQAPKKSRTGLWVSGGIILAIIIFLGFAIKVPVDNKGYMDRAKASCAKQYTNEYEINNCAIRLGFEKLGEIQRDKMDSARSGVR